jgi:Cysteine-rich secretory protein family
VDRVVARDYPVGMPARGVRGALRVGVTAGLIVCLGSGLASAAPLARRDAGPVSWRREVMKLMNDARARTHRPRLRINRPLSRAALAHSRRMVAERRVFRTAGVAGLVRPYGATLWAEELGKGKSLRAIVRAWLHHGDTRWHLLDARMRHAGVGVRFAHRHYWVTVYLHD